MSDRTSELFGLPPQNSKLKDISPRSVKIHRLTRYNGSSSNSKNSQYKALIVPSTHVQKPLSCKGEIEQAIIHLHNADPLLASLIDSYPPPTFNSFNTPFLALTRSILHQQLAPKAGSSICDRFFSLCGGESRVLPEVVLSLTPHQLRKIGISMRKTSYLHDLARKYQAGILSDSSIMNMDDKSLFTMLMMVNGIGTWSVHMFMIFWLHRPDVLPIKDHGVRKGVQLLYNMEELPRPSQMDQLCRKWRPYRSVASWYIWKFLESRGSHSSALAVTASGTMMQHEQIHEKHNHHVDSANSILNLRDI